MSKLKEKLKQVSMSSPLPMGFKMAQKASRPRMAILALFAKGGPVDPLAYITGADAGLIEWPAAGMLKKLVKADADIPWGVRLEKGGVKSPEEITAAGADFLFFQAEDMPLSLAEDEKTGKVLMTGLLPGDGWVRSLNKLPIDALFISEQALGDGVFTWRQLITCRYFSDMVAKPVLVPVPVDVKEAELQAIWDAGVDGVVVGIEAGTPEDRLSKIRKMIDGLTPPSKRREKGITVLLPAMKEEARPAVEEQDEEEEEEE